MAHIFEELLAQKGVLLTDGATGTSLFNMGLQAGDAPELWNVEKPDLIRKLYKDAVDAGSDLFLTNTFGGTAARLKLHNAQDRVHELNFAGAELGREIADAADRPVIVAGSVGPTGEIMEPIGPLSKAEATDMFTAQAQGLKDGGVDMAWVETISAIDEFTAAAEAFAAVDLPWCGTMSFDTAGRTMMGVTSVDLAKLIPKLPHQPLAFGANCGVGASDLLRTVLGFSSAGPERPIIAKGNAGIPKYHDGHIHYDGTPELMADYAQLARDCGAQIIGGCCGTTPKHIAAMREALDTRPRGDRPAPEVIAERLGGFSSPSDGLDAAPAARKSRRRARG
ncbi:MAG: betaine--homocysteine S-methyltransferase [Pseudomonadota bacterium]